MLWTEPQLVIDAWVGDGAPDDVELVELWVGRAERLLRRKVPDLQARLDSGLDPDLVDTVRDVVVDLVQGVFRNPEGVRQRQESVGSFAGSVTFSGDSPGRLELTGDHLEALTDGAAGKRRAFTVDMLPTPVAPAYVPNLWS